MTIICDFNAAVKDTVQFLHFIVDEATMHVLMMTLFLSTEPPMKQSILGTNPATPVNTFKYCIIPIIHCWLALLAMPVQAACTGCLCPGDPCQLCPLPAMTDDPEKPDEHNLCARIREKVPPTSAPPGSSEYFPSLDRSIAACVSEGGDVIRNRQRGTEFTSRFYCKPPTPLHKLQ